jgi:protein-disulfide isomerase
MQDHNDEEPSQPQDQQHQPKVEPPSAVRTDQQHGEAHIEPTTAGGLISARPQRSARWRRLAAIAAIAAIVVATLAAIVVTAGGNSGPPKSGSPQANTTAHAISVLLAGIPQTANTLGNSTAPITLKWYGDLECPFCKQFALGALPTLITRWVRAGQLKIEYLSMETATRDAKVFLTQQVAALAAGMQNKMWNYIETFYHEQGEEDTGYVTEHYLRALAIQVPSLHLIQWQADRNNQQLANRVTDERQTAIRAHFRGTPTFLIGRSNVVMYRLRPRSLTNPALFNEAIEYLTRR